jgi:hypothetical protein
MKEGRRRRRTTKMIWEDGVDNDVKVLQERNRKNIATTNQAELVRKFMAKNRGMFC